MKKLLFILACVIVPQSAFGAVVYQKTGQDSSTNTNAYRLYEPASIGGSATASPPDFYTSTEVITTLRVIENTGSCASVVGIVYSNFTVGRASGMVTHTGNYCDYTNWVSGDFPIGTSFTGFYFPTDTGIYKSSASNSGYLYDTTYLNPIAGGFAFALCSSNNCTGAFSPPTDGITSTPTPTASTYANNPVPFSGVYNNGISQAYDTIQFDLVNTTQSFETFFSLPAQPISQTGLTYSTTKNLPLEGNYTYNVRLWNTGLATSTAWFAGTGFALATTTATSTPLLNAPPLVCDTFDVACYVKKAFIWLLYPTDALVSSYDSFLTTIQEKPPIGYFTLLTAQLTTLNASSTPIVNFIIPASLKTYIFTPFDVAIASILWFYFAIHFYKRLKTITI